MTEITCPKCGGDNLSVGYNYRTNRLDCGCRRCEYRWDETPLDQKKAEIKPGKTVEYVPKTFLGMSFKIEKRHKIAVDSAAKLLEETRNRHGATCWPGTHYLEKTIEAAIYEAEKSDA